MILDSLSPIDSLVIFSVRYISADYRSADTFLSIHVGAYYERIFRVFPSLRACHLLFGRQHYRTEYDPFHSEFAENFPPIQSNLLNLRSLTLRNCLPKFLSHLFEHLPQLQQFNCHFFQTFWMSQQHSLEHDYNKYVSSFSIIYFN